MANVLVQDGAGVAKYLKATGDGSNGDPFVVQHLMGSGATDGAAAAGELYPIAGLYQSSVDEIDAGDVGRVRMTPRRALLHARDGVFAAANGASVQYAADITISRTSVTSGFSALISGDLDYSGIGTDPFWLRIPMQYWESGATIFIYNTLAVNMTYTLLLNANPYPEWSSLATTQIDACTLAAGEKLIFSPYACGATPGTTVARHVPMLLAPALSLIVKCQAASDPVSGYMLFSVIR